MTPYPLALDLAGRRVVVVGGGRVALRRAAAMLAAGALVRVIAPDVTAELAGLDVRPASGATGTATSPARGSPTPPPTTLTSTRAVAAEAERRRIWCVRADDADASPAWTPAATRHGDVTVAVTAGGDPRRAQRLRAAIALALAEGSLPVRPQRRPAPAPAAASRWSAAGRATRAC